MGTSWPLGSATVQLLGPVRAYEDTNDTSLVLRIDYGQTSYLLTGDMEAEAERDLVTAAHPWMWTCSRWGITGPHLHQLCLF